MNLWLILIIGVIVGWGAWQRSRALGAGKSRPDDQIGNKEQLGRSLADAIHFLDKQGSSAWAGVLREIRDELQQAGREAAALARLGELFGGMGSLNDVALADAALDQELDRLLNTLFRDLKLYHGVPADRAQWAALEQEHQGELAPRIRHAFRGPPDTR